MRSISSIPATFSRARRHPADANRRSGAVRAAAFVLAVSVGAVLAPGGVLIGKALLTQVLLDQAANRAESATLRNG